MPCPCEDPFAGRGRRLARITTLAARSKQRQCHRRRLNSLVRDVCHASAICFSCAAFFHAMHRIRRNRLIAPQRKNPGFRRGS
ncbi:hypothetical protein [Lysobacter gummosus]|uniref:hypothetical protein n=1 Tax=Lysobacter gummosus TaxID=262324 RepID=UPI00363BB1B5